MREGDAPRVLDLCSGIGGFSLGLERAGFRTVAFCELDAHCRRVLAKHWPGVPIYDDVRHLTAARLHADGIERIDTICGGFPCQDISLAGKGAGLDGERSGIWREFARLIGELRPELAIVENVGALRGRGLAAVLADLAALGYDAQWHAVPAAAVGAPHLRDRVWIVAAAADADSERLRQHEQRPAGGRHDLPHGGHAVAVDDGAPRSDSDDEHTLRKCKRCGCTESLIGGEPASICWYCRKAYPNPNRRRREGERLAQHAEQQGAPGPEPERLGAWGWRHGSTAPEPERERRAQLRGLFGRLAEALAAASTPWQRTAEPPLCRMDDGIPAGLDGRARRAFVKAERERVKQLGNAVVPLIPELIGRALMAERQAA